MQASEVILYAEDEETDAFFVERALRQAGVSQRLVVVRNGQEAIDYLSGKDDYGDRKCFPLPSLVLLDLNMPGVSGLDVLKWIRTTPSVCTLVTIVLTSSNQDTDVYRAYQQGANGYLVKPSDLDSVLTMARAIKDYWLTQNRATPVAANQAARNGG